MAHTILLLQRTGDTSSRIYFDYPSVDDAMTGVCKIFESHLKEEHPTARNITYDVKELFQFIDKLDDLAALVYNDRTSSYQPYSKEWIKQKVLAHLKRLASR